MTTKISAPKGVKWIKTIKKLNNKQVIRIKDSSETLTKLRKRIDIGKVLLGSKQYDTIRNNLIL